MNICMCGAEDGYPHAPDCPYPLFRASEQQQDKWEADRLTILAAQTCPHEWHDYGSVTNALGTRRIVACQLCGMEQ